MGFRPKKVGLVDSDWKNGVSTGIQVLVNFDRKNGVLLILAKTPVLTEKVVFVDFDRKYSFGLM